jgi:hypothetical protein
MDVCARTFEAGLPDTLKKRWLFLPAQHFNGQILFEKDSRKIQELQSKWSLKTDR